MIRPKMIIDVIGIKILKLGLSITISPGNLPNGSFEIQGKTNPASNNIIPTTIKIF